MTSFSDNPARLSRHKKNIRYVIMRESVGIHSVLVLSISSCSSNIFKHSSHNLPLLKGVPLGTILGPLLFSLFINSIPDELKHMMYHIFADDVQIYKSFKQEDSITSLVEINKDLRAIQSWAFENKLNLNVAKTQAIAISTNNETRYLPPLWLNGLIVPYSSTVKNLGMLFNKKLDWKEHVDLVCGKIYKSLRSTWPRFSVTPKVTRIMLAKSLFLPHIEYCSIVYSYGMSMASKNMLEKAFGAMIRYAFGIRKYDSIRNYMDKLLGFSLSKFLSEGDDVYIQTD